MRTLVTRVSVLVFVAVLVLAVAVVALGDQPKMVPTNGGTIPDHTCPPGVSPAPSFCLPPLPSNKVPDTLDTPPPTPTHKPVVPPPSPPVSAAP
jgi:hypothetical protein